MKMGICMKVAIRGLLGAVLLLPVLARTAGAQGCVGDCNDVGQVSTANLVTLLYVALDQLPYSACSQADANGNGRIDINEVVQAVDNSIGGCEQCGDDVVEGSEQCDGTDLGVCPDGAGCFPPGDPNQCQCKPASCAAIDANSGGSNSSGTFMVTSTGAPGTGKKYCGGLSSSICAGNSNIDCSFGDDTCGESGPCVHNAFNPCESDADCGGSAGQCLPIPWLGVASFTPYPIVNVVTNFIAGPPDAKCVHQATVPCIGSADPCPATPKLGTGHPCCQTPGFKVDTFFIAALGFCSRVDQTACGGGVVDTSVPMLGDNDVTKVADTTTPTGPDCSYTSSDTHPACGASEDALGQIKTTIGDGNFDPEGGHTRLNIPQRSVTWLESTAPPCSPTSTFDGSESPISVFDLVLSTTTANATASYQDVNGDGVNFCGFGPAVFNNVAHGKPDLPGLGSLTVAMGTALSGGGPTFDLLFSSVTPLTSPVKVEPMTTCEPAPPGCPE